MMCSVYTVSIKHPIHLFHEHPMGMTCYDVAIPCVVERRVISHHQATFECPQKFPFHLCFNLLLVPCPCLFGLASALWITRVRTDSTRMQIKRIKESLMGGLRAGGGGGGWVGGCDSIPLGFHFGIAPTSLRFIPSFCSPHLDFL